MRQNLTNVKETQLDKVDSFYVVGSTHKDGILGNENYKLNLKSLGGGSINLNDTDALKALYYAMMDALTLVVITEDMCVYDDTQDSDYYGTYTVTLPDMSGTTFPAGMNPIFAVSGLFKDTAGNTHRLETLKLQSGEGGLTGSWTESSTPYKLILSPTSDTEGRMSIVGLIG